MSRGPGEVPGRRLSRPAAVTIFALFLSLLTGCGNDYLLVVDPVFETLLPPERILRQIEERTNHSVGLAPSLKLDGNFRNQIDAILSAENPERGVILTPLLFNEAPSLASDYPERGFLLLAEAPNETPNLMSIRFDRIEAFREAGIATEANLEKTGASLVLLFEGGSEVARRELAAFEEPLSQASVGRRFVYSRAPERETIRQQILSVGEGEHLWATFLRGNTPFALDLIASRREPAVAEDLGPGEGYGGFVIGSVERDYIEAINRGIGALEGSGAGESVLVVPAVFVRRSEGLAGHK